MTRKFLSSNNTKVSVFGYVNKTSEKGYKIKDILGKEGWVAKHLVTSRKPVEGKKCLEEFQMPEWLAEKNGWI